MNLIIVEVPENFRKIKGYTLGYLKFLLLDNMLRRPKVDSMASLSIIP